MLMLCVIVLLAPGIVVVARNIRGVSRIASRIDFCDREHGGGVVEEIEDRRVAPVS